MQKILSMLLVVFGLVASQYMGSVDGLLDAIGFYAPLKSTGVLAEAGRAQSAASLSDIPEYQGNPYVIINSNVPFFHGEGQLPDGYEEYSSLDSMERCGAAEANISHSTMPTGKRGPIGMVKPSGWHTVRYDDIIDKKYLYNRCHLIGFQLAGENANEKNLITGTRYLNVEGMLPFENEVAAYVKHTGNHVRYRVTPIFHGDELVARGVLMEAESVEDGGRGVRFNIYCYNVQPGIVIDYLTGESRVAE